jgi:hypothetical protein
VATDGHRSTKGGAVQLGARLVERTRTRSEVHRPGQSGLARTPLSIFGTLNVILDLWLAAPHLAARQVSNRPGAAYTWHFSTHHRRGPPALSRAARNLVPVDLDSEEGAFIGDRQSLLVRWD